MVWTPELIEQLKGQWALGLSITQIGKNLGLTRNAVVGKAHRLGLSKRESPIQKSTTPRPQPAPVIAPPVTVPAMAAAVAPPPPRKVAVDPNYRGPKCKWPVGDPKTTDFHFCAAPSLDGYPYCSEHCAAAYTNWHVEHKQTKAA